MSDKVIDSLVAALRQALVEPSEQRLYKSGKLAGLFHGRAGANAEAAARALRDGLLEATRTEIRGKTTIEWVRLTPRGVEFLHEHESPTQALTELRGVLQTTREGIPVWLAEMRRDLHALAESLADDARRWLEKLDHLSRRVDEALYRVEANGLQLPDGAAIVPWAREALGYLDRRRGSGAATPCLLPELYAALTSAGHNGLSVTDFHEGLRLLRKRGFLRLLPASGDVAEPEYALQDGADVLYYAER